MPLKVALAQIAPEKAEVELNLDTIADAIMQASAEGAELVLLPEAATTGYFLEGGTLESSLTADELAEKLTLRLRMLRPVDALIGFYQRADGNLYNAAAYLEIGSEGVQVKGVYRKFFLPTYGVFDEERFVARGTQLGVFDTRLGRVGVLICEDVWHSILPTLCAVAGAQMILVVSASPGRGFSGEHVGNLDRYARMLKGVSEEHGVYCLNCQLCGFEGGKGFVGGSMVVDPNGEIIAQSPVLDPHLLLAEIDLDLIPIARNQTPLLADLQSAWGDVRRIVGEV
jgi:N-carbamoylputrescine amidase